MRFTTLMVVVVFALTSCVGGKLTPPTPDITLPQLTLTSPVANALSFDDAAPLAFEGTSSVVPLFAIPNIQTNQGTLALAFWGTKDTNGEITQITEAGVSGLINDVHVFFDTSERPVYVRDDATGYAMKVSYDSATQQTVTVCDPSGSVVASSQVTSSGGSYQAGDAYAGGSCTLSSAAAVVRHTNAATSGTTAYTDLSKLSSLSQLITAGSSIAGLAFALGSILKFKQHKDNPTQVPIGTPIALVFIAAALLFLPSVLSATGVTLFGTYSASATTDDLASYLPEVSILGCGTSSATCPFPSPDPTP